jgi:hypothetical protein
MMRENGSNSALALGSAGTPSLKFTGDTNTGIYSPGADQVAISTNGTGRLFVDSSGLVAIGSNSAGGSRLCVHNGSILVRSDGDILKVNDVADTSYWFRMSRNGSNFEISNRQAGSIVFLTSDIERLRLTSTGALNFVGAGTAGSTQAVSFNGSAPINSLVIDSSGNVSSNTNTFFIDRANSRVGLGTSSPDRLLHVSAADTAYIRLENQDSTGSVDQYVGLIEFEGQDSGGSGVRAQIGGIYEGVSGATALVFGTSADAGSVTERLRINRNGNVGIGTSSPGNKLAVIGTTGALADASIRINGTAGTQSANSGLWITGNQTTSHHNWLIGSQYNVSNGFEITPSTAVDGATFSTPALVVTSAGRVGIGTTSPGKTLEVSTASSTDGIALSRAGSNRVLLTADGIVAWGATANQGTLTWDANQAIIKAAASNSLLFAANNSAEHARIDTSGRLLVGTSTARTNFNTGAEQSHIQLEGTTFNTSNLSIVRNSANDGTAALTLGKSRSATVNGNTVVVSGDPLGFINFEGADGTNMVRGASITAQVDGTPGTNDMPGRLVFSTTADGASSPTERMRIRNDGSILIQQTALSSASDGCYFNANTPANFHQLLCHSTATSSLANLYLNRQGSDGTLIDFRQADTTEGSVSVSGTTVSFNGGHLSRWSQLPNEEDPSSILKGTVMSNLDEMCEWGEEDNEQLNKTKVSDVEGDPNVAGVFVATSFSEDGPLDFYLAMTGDMIIRIAEGVTVQRGQLLMSAGDGTAKPQGDGFVQDKTIAKVTSTHVTCTYDDGSYCVPCVLMAC